MVVYLFYYFLIGVSAFLIPKFSIKHKAIGQFIILFGGLFLIMALRHPSMGTDLQYESPYGYLGMFQTIGKTPWSNLLNNPFFNYDKGYIVFNKILSLVSLNQQWFIACCAFVSLLPIFIIYRKYSNSFELSIIIYMALVCFLMTFSGMRQACAIGICTGSFYFIKEKKIIPFVLLVILAWTFHSSAILFLIAYPAYRININRKMRVATIVLILVVFVFRTPLFNLFARFIKENAEPDNNGAIGLFLAFVFVYIFCFVFGSDDKEYSGLLNLFLLAVICQAFGNIYSTAGRIGYYFMPFLGLLLPKTILNFDKSERQLVRFFLVRSFFVAVFLSYGIYSIYISGFSWAHAYPYHFYWETI